MFAYYETVIGTYPSHHLYRYNYAVELYQHSYKTDIKQRPSNSAQLVDKAEAQVTEAVRLAPSYARGQLFAGQIRYNKGVDLLNESKAATTDDKKKERKAKAMEKFKEAIPYFEAVDRLLAGQPGLKAEDKSDLKEAYDLLITIYDQAGDKTKVLEYEKKFNAVENK